jgi:hypothetical protein
MADEATDVQANEITLDDFNADEQESPKAESSPVDDKKPEVVEKPTEPKEEVKADDTATETKESEAKGTETEGEVQDKAEETETKPQTKADERKTQLNTEIRDLVAQRSTLRDEVTRLNAEVYQPATEQELEADGMSATDAKVEALRQQIEVRDFNERVAEAQLTIESEANRVMQDFPTFNPESSEYDEELSNEASQLLQANLVRDPNSGQIIGSNVSPYQLYKTLARASGISATKAQLKGQEATEKMLANADTAGSASPPKEKTDPLVELWKSDD